MTSAQCFSSREEKENLFWQCAGQPTLIDLIFSAFCWQSNVFLRPQLPTKRVWYKKVVSLLAILKVGRGESCLITMTCPVSILRASITLLAGDDLTEKLVQVFLLPSQVSLFWSQTWDWGVLQFPSGMVYDWFLYFPHLGINTDCSPNIEKQGVATWEYLKEERFSTNR